MKVKEWVDITLHRLIFVYENVIKCSFCHVFMNLLYKSVAKSNCRMWDFRCKFRDFLTSPNEWKNYFVFGLSRYNTRIILLRLIETWIIMMKVLWNIFIFITFAGYLLRKYVELRSNLCKINFILAIFCC